MRTLPGGTQPLTSDVTTLGCSLRHKKPTREAVTYEDPLVLRTDRADDLKEMRANHSAEFMQKLKP